MLKPFLIFITIAAALSSCNKPAPSIPAVAPIDSIIGTFPGRLHYTYIIGSAATAGSTPDTTDSTYSSVVTVTRVTADSFKITSSINWFALTQYNGAIPYSHTNTYGPGIITFYPLKDSLHISTSYTQGWNYQETWLQEFNGKRAHPL